MKLAANEQPQAEAPKKNWICPVIEIIDAGGIMGGPRTFGESSTSGGVHGGSAS